MAFLESPRFADEIAFWMSGGRGFKTTIVETYGGDEYRNGAWTFAKAEYVIRTEPALRAINQASPYAYKALRDMFMVALGSLNAFRFKDYRDFQDDGGGIFVMLTSTTFQMYKRYTVSPLTYQQIIQKPVSASVVVTGGSGPVVDYTTGIVTVSSGTPTSWTGQFDIPVRFGSDVPDVGPESTGSMYDWQSLRLVEVRNP